MVPIRQICGTNPSTLKRKRGSTDKVDVRVTDSSQGVLPVLRYKSVNFLSLPTRSTYGVSSFKPTWRAISGASILVMDRSYGLFISCTSRFLVRICQLLEPTDKVDVRGVLLQAHMARHLWGVDGTNPSTLVKTRLLCGSNPSNLWYKSVHVEAEKG